LTLAGFDTSLPTTSVCIVREDGEAFCTPPPPPERLLGPACHSAELLPELDRRMAEAGARWQDVGSIAVGIGPGTFTGLRIGVATARALAQALGVRVRPVSSLEALAAGATGQENPSSEWRGRAVLALIDARRNQVFAALYDVEEPSSPGDDDGVHAATLVRALWKPAVLDPDILLKRVRALARPVVCAGDWAIRFGRELGGAGAGVPPPESGVHAVSALQICNLALAVKPIAPEYVYPTYLRLPDAEINRRLAEQQTR
jgi:tRNA threonylcarbamoyladenosine biosynthesis protein TsaB